MGFCTHRSLRKCHQHDNNSNRHYNDGGSNLQPLEDEESDKFAADISNLKSKVNTSLAERLWDDLSAIMNTSEPVQNKDSEDHVQQALRLEEIPTSVVLRFLVRTFYVDNKSWLHCSIFASKNCVVLVSIYKCSDMFRLL